MSQITNIPNNYMFRSGAIVQRSYLPDGGQVQVVADGAPSGVPYYSAPPPLEGTSYIQLDYKESSSGPGTEKSSFVLKPQFDYFTIQAVQPKLDKINSTVGDMFIGFLVASLFMGLTNWWLMRRMDKVKDLVEDLDFDLRDESSGDVPDLVSRVELLETQKMALNARIGRLEDKIDPPASENK